MLEARWPWFAEELEAVRARQDAATEARDHRVVIGSPAYADSSDDEPIDGVLQRASSPLPSRRAARSTATIRPPSRVFPLMTSTLHLPLPSSDVKALLQYFYSLSLLTPLQRSLPTLSSFLSFTKTYDTVLPSLRTLVVHALHETLDDHPEAAAKVYEAAALGDSVALQIRAMQVMLKGGMAGDASPLAGEARRGSASTDAGRSRYSLYSQGASLPSERCGDVLTPMRLSSVELVGLFGPRVGQRPRPLEPHALSRLARQQSSFIRLQRRQPRRIEVYDAVFASAAASASGLATPSSSAAKRLASVSAAAYHAGSASSTSFRTLFASVSFASRLSLAIPSFPRTAQRANLVAGRSLRDERHLDFLA